MLKTIMLFLHVLGAVGMGTYLIMPMLAGQFRKISGAAQEGLASGLMAGGRIGQMALVVQLLTGGYLISQMGSDYTVAWMIVVLVLFLAIGALSGIVQKPVRQIAELSREGKDASGPIGKLRTLSAIILILFLVVMWLMKDPWYVV